MLAFSFTVPLTRVAVDGLDGLFLGSARAVVAAVLAAGALIIMRSKIPDRNNAKGLAAVFLGVVLGFPLLTSVALESVPAAHAAVVIGLLPASTAIASVARTGERPSRAFWVASLVGAGAVVVFVTVINGELGAFEWADLLLVGAVVAAAVGYAEGAILSRTLGSWQTVSWALVFGSPIMAIIAITRIDERLVTASTEHWLAFAYLAAVSIYFGFFAWYRGLAIGPVARVSQVQLVQPVLSILWAAFILEEHIGWQTFVCAGVVIASVAVAVRSRVATLNVSTDDAEDGRR